MDTTIRELAKMLSARTESLCRRFLPGGSREGDRWHVGNLRGDKGRSLHINLHGEHAGWWRDEESGESGDIIDLWRETQSLSMVETLDQVRAELGIKSPDKALNAGKSPKKHGKPKPVVGLAHEGTPVWKYLTEERKIPGAVVQRFKVGEESGVIVFRYCDYTGKRHIHSKYLKLARKNGKKESWVSKDTPPVLYGWQAMRDIDRSVVICEGEIDCMTLRGFGIPALSVPMGAGNKQDAWIEVEYDHLDRFEHVYIWMDNDDAGRAATENIVRRLGAHRCKVVEWPEDLPEGCDVTELATVHGWTVTEIGKLVLAAQFRGPEELASAAQFKDAVDETFDPSPESAKTHFRLPWAGHEQPVDFRPGEVSIWSGYGGSGKSLILGQLVLHGANLGIHTVIASLEMPPGDTLHRMVRQATGQERPEKVFRHEIMDWLDDKLWLFQVVGTAKADRLMEVCRYAARRYGIKQVVIDSLMKLGVREDDYPGQKALVEALTDFATELQVHVHLVAHSRKPLHKEDASGFSIKGSGGIRDLAHNVLLVKRNKEKELVMKDPDSTEEQRQEFSKRPDCVLTVDKNRRYGWEGPVCLWLHPGSLQYLPGGVRDPAPIYRRPTQEARHG